MVQCWPITTLGYGLVSPVHYYTVPTGNSPVEQFRAEDFSQKIAVRKVKPFGVDGIVFGAFIDWERMEAFEYGTRAVTEG
jgi:hypothetical protein